MSLSIKEIRFRFDQRFIQITPMGWVESSSGHILGRLLRDPHTKKLYFRSNILSSHTQARIHRINFLSKFRYTQQLSCLNVGFNTVHYVVELHGFIKDM